MKFVRTKKLVFLNNKWWVGKTTIAYNTAVKFAEMGYKTVLIDADPQCNLSRLALGEGFDMSIFSGESSSIYGVLRGIVEGGADIDMTIPFHPLSPNLSILPGSLKLSRYADLLITAYNQAASGQEIGYFQTSALSRYLMEKWLKEEIDIFIIDVSPSLDLLNRIILLSADYFVTPLMPDAFSVQGIENLGLTLEAWKENWKNTGKALARGISSERVLSGEGLFIGYIVNSYNQYAQKPISSHQEWMEKIPEYIKRYLSERHCRNGLVEKSWKHTLTDIKDFWQLPADGQISNKAIFNLIPGTDFQSVPGTLENLELAKEQFDRLAKNIEEILQKY